MKYNCQNNKNKNNNALLMSFKQIIKLVLINYMNKFQI